jgi:ficolin
LFLFSFSLRIDLKPWNAPIQIAEYGQFSLDNEIENYKLQISQFNSNISTAGDSLSSLWDNANQASFSTYDRDYDNLFYDNCALIYHGAWWFTNCFQSHLNGVYIRSPFALQNTARNGLHWNTYSLYHSMKETTMRIRRKNTFDIY